MQWNVAKRFVGELRLLSRSVRGALGDLGAPMEPLPVPIESDRREDVLREALLRDRNRW